jgi:hypothetical protein
VVVFQWLDIQYNFSKPRCGVLQKLIEIFLPRKRKSPKVQYLNNLERKSEEYNQRKNIKRVRKLIAAVSLHAF